MTILDDNNDFKKVFQTTTLWMIFITVFLCGGTIKPLVNFLHIEKQEKNVKEKMFDDVNKKCIDHVMSGIETIVGKNHRISYWLWFEDQYLNKLLLNKNSKHEMALHFDELMNQHYARLYGPTLLVTGEQIPEFLERDEQSITITSDDVQPDKK